MRTTATGETQFTLKGLIPFRHVGYKASFIVVDRGKNDHEHVVEVSGVDKTSPEGWGANEKYALDPLKLVLGMLCGRSMTCVRKIMGLHWGPGALGVYWATKPSDGDLARVSLAFYNRHLGLSDPIEHYIAPVSAYSFVPLLRTTAQDYERHVCKRILDAIDKPKKTRRPTGKL